MAQHQNRGPASDAGSPYQVIFDITGLATQTELDIRILSGNATWSMDGGVGLKLSGNVQLSSMSLTTQVLDIVGGSQSSNFRIVVEVATPDTKVDVTSIIPSTTSISYTTSADSGILSPGRFTIPLA